MQSTIKVCRKHGVAGIRHIAKLLYSGTGSSSLAGYGNWGSELPALESGLAVGGRDGGDVEEFRLRHGGREDLEKERGNNVEAEHD